MRFPLDDFRAFSKYHPWYFWGFYNDSILRIDTSCQMVVREHGWFGTREAGRDDLRSAIDRALEKLTRFLRYSPIPHQQYDTALNVEPHGPAKMGYHYGAGAPFAVYGWHHPAGQFIQLKEGYIKALGRETIEEVQTAAVTRHDDDGDGVSERFTASFVHPEGVSLDDLGVFFAEGARYDGSPIGERWEIAARLSSDGATITATGAGWLLARPVLYEGLPGLTNTGIDPMISGNFVTQLQLGRRVIDATNAVRVTALAGGYCCAQAATTDYTATATIVDAQNGLIRLDGGCGCGSGVARRADVDYVAGVPLVEGRAHPRWRDVISMLACAELDRRICACDGPDDTIQYFSRDYANQDNNYQPPPDGAVRWFGPREGHAAAWRAVAHEVHTVSLIM